MKAIYLSLCTFTAICITIILLWYSIPMRSVRHVPHNIQNSEAVEQTTMAFQESDLAEHLGQSVSVQGVCVETKIFLMIDLKDCGLFLDLSPDSNRPLIGRKIEAQGVLEFIKKNLRLPRLQKRPLQGLKAGDTCYEMSSLNF